MLFSSPFFIFFLLPAFLLLYFISSAKYRDYILLTCSIGFYFWGEPIFSLVAILSSLLDYWLCKKIFQNSLNHPKAKIYLIVGIIANLALLVYYKYSNFFFANINMLLAHTSYHFELLDILLPIGVSFIVFEKITYLVDVYRGTGKPAAKILHYLNYVFLFPKLLAGPIIKYHEIEKQLQKHIFSIIDVAEGFKRFIRGLLKKVLIADTCAELVNQIFSLPATEIGFSLAWLGVICFTLQIYFDFSGYSDMALGLARMFGFTLRENFNMPYIATSFTEFWRRWHISLSTWIREYLYIPLGGNKFSETRTYVNLWLCFLISGLWHGANWTFVLWGAYNGLFLVIDKLFWLRISNNLPRIVNVFLTLPFIMLGWAIFRSNDLSQFHAYATILFNPIQQSQAYIDITSNMIAAIIIGSIISLGALMPGYARLNHAYATWELRTHFESFVFSALGFFALCKIVGVTFNPFLYFRF